MSEHMKEDPMSSFSIQNAFHDFNGRLSASSAGKILVSAIAFICAGAMLASSASASDRQQVTLNFEALINGQPFRCGEAYPQVGLKAAAIVPTDFRFFVSGIELVRRDGKAVPLALEQDGRWQVDDIALLDFEDGAGPCRNGSPALNTTVRGSIPKADYSGLRFILGVPFERNHADPTLAPAPLNQTAMFWNWRGGYKFLKFDTTTVPMAGTPSTGAPGAGTHGDGGAATSGQAAHAGGHGRVPGYSIHLGSTVCTSPSPTVAPSACANSNRVTVQFDPFDPVRSVIVADIGRILARSDVSSNAPGTSPGCMSFPKDADCPPIMGALGLDYDGQRAAGPQSLFSLR
jgi:uncharacterized repeat protein (TIGR04052 family)